MQFAGDGANTSPQADCSLRAPDKRTTSGTPNTEWYTLPCYPMIPNQTIPTTSPTPHYTNTHITHSNVHLILDTTPKTQMASLKTPVDLPQEGILTGESLPVARPPHADGRVAGCPSYSGGGKETPRASHDPRPLASTRTPTDAINTQTKTAIGIRTTTDKQTNVDPSTDSRTIDMSSLADAIHQPPPVESAWTLVAHRPKRKRTNRRRNRNRRTDTPTAGSGRPEAGGTGGEASTAAHVKARGPVRRNEAGVPPTGRRLPVTTDASGCNESRVEAAQPGTSRGPPADDRKKHVTDNDNRPAQRRPHPVAPRSNAYWRGRSSGAADEGTGNSGPSTKKTNQKRDRLDDTISPRGEPKRRKTDRPTHEAGSYARATKPHLNVAVALVPRANMTQQEADGVQGLVENEIFATCLKGLTPGATPYAPAFEGRAILSEGVLKLWCHDEQSLLWLQEVVPRLKSPREGTGLTLIKQSEIPVRVRSCLFVPKYEGEVGKLHLYLTLQNPWYEVSTWTLYTYQRVYGRTPGVFLVLGIPKEQINNILARGRKVAYSTGSIYIRFFSREGTSEVPPAEAPKPDTHQDTKTPGESAQTDTTTPMTVTNTQTDIPSVDSPLSITSVISSTPSSPTQGQTRWEETTETDMTDTTARTIQELMDTCTDKTDNRQS